jgi:hypothetical protein
MYLLVLVGTQFMKNSSLYARGRVFSLTDRLSVEFEVLDFILNLLGESLKLLHWLTAV